MNCPHCNAPFMGGMTVCPKCKYDTKARHGGAKHLQWLIDQGSYYSADLAAAYPEVISHNEEALKEKEEALKEAERMIEIKAERDAAIANILISSGFDFDGCSHEDVCSKSNCCIFSSDRSTEVEYTPMIVQK